MTITLLLLLLFAEPVKAQAPPEVTPQEQITLLKLQVDELATKNAALEAQIRRIDGVGKLADAWNKRGCIVENDPSTGLIRCRLVEVVKPEAKKDEKK